MSSIGAKNMITTQISGYKIRSKTSCVHRPLHRYSQVRHQKIVIRQAGSRAPTTRSSNSSSASKCTRTSREKAVSFPYVLGISAKNVVHAWRVLFLRHRDRDPDRDLAVRAGHLFRW